MSERVIRYDTPPAPQHDALTVLRRAVREDYWPIPTVWPKDEKARAKWRELYYDLPPEDVRSDDEKARDKMLALLSGEAPDEERHDEEAGLPPDEVARRAMIRRSNAA